MVFTLIRKIEALSKDNNWQACELACGAHTTQTPVARVIKAGIRCCEMKREEMENALQEAILKEIPPMERFLSTLGMLAAIAPLLGLLGTVTGMIDTFHVITMHGCPSQKSVHSEMIDNFYMPVKLKS